MKDYVAELIVKEKWPLLDVTSGAYTEEIEKKTVDNVRKHIENYGVEIIRFGDFTIGMDDADKERLDKMVERKAYIDMTGGLQGYKELAQAEMMMGAGEGMKKGGDGGGGGNGALAGAGIGMGIGMAGQMMGNMGQSSSQASSQAISSTATKNEIMNTLKQLGELKEQGIVTEQEFEAKKKELLAKL